MSLFCEVFQMWIAEYFVIMQLWQRRENFPIEKIIFVLLRIITDIITTECFDNMKFSYDYKIISWVTFSNFSVLLLSKCCSLLCTFLFCTKRNDTWQVCFHLTGMKMRMRTMKKKRLHQFFSSLPKSRNPRIVNQLLLGPSPRRGITSIEADAWRWWKVFEIIVVINYVPIWILYSFTRIKM